jgi:hypothetical protein
MLTNVVPLRSAQQPSHVPALMLGLSPVRRMSMPNGDRGTAFTIGKLRELVHQGMTDQFINRQAMAIVRAAGVREFDFLGEIRAIYEWTRRNIRFFKDIDGVETLRTAREIITVGGGDCDDINATLMPALLATIGHSVRLVTISSDPQAPEAFSHVYCQVQLSDGRWLDLDAARRDPAFGKGPQRWFRKRVWSLTDNDYRDVGQIGLGGYFMETRTRSGRRQMRRMGDFEDIADSLAKIIQPIGTATANIINATNGGIRVPGYATNPATGQLVPIGPQGQLMVSSAPGGIFTSASGSIPTWLLAIGGVVGGLLLVNLVKK